MASWYRPGRMPIRPARRGRRHSAIASTRHFDAACRAPMLTREQSGMDEHGSRPRNRFWRRSPPCQAPTARRSPPTGKLSDIVVTDGKVFFSITVDAAHGAAMGARCASAPRPRCARCRACSRPWSRSRPNGRAAARAPARAERHRSAARGLRRPPPCRHGAGAPCARTAHGAGRHSRRRRDHRGRLRQGRRRQIDDRHQSRARLARPRPQGRRARCRHLRAVAAEAARHQASGRRRSAARGSSRSRATACTVMSIGFLDRGGDADDLARADGDVGADADAARGGVGHARRHGGRHAARHRRRAAHHGAAGAAQGRRHRLDAAGPGADRRAARHRHVPARQRAGARHRREHDYFICPHCGDALGYFRPRRRAARSRAARRAVPRRSAARTSRSARNPTPARRWSRPRRTAPHAKHLSATSPRGARRLSASQAARRRRS